MPAVHFASTRWSAVTAAGGEADDLTQDFLRQAELPVR